MIRKPSQSFEALQERILKEVPAADELWQRTEAKRKIAFMLARLRTEQGLSQKDISERAGWDKAFVSRLEAAGGSIPDTETIARYVQACGATAGIVVGTLIDSAHMHVVDAVTLPAKDAPTLPARDAASSTKDADIEIAFEKLRERDITLADGV